MFQAEDHLRNSAQAQALSACCEESARHVAVWHEARGVLERWPTCKPLAVVCSCTSFGDIALAASLGALLWGVELLAAGGFGCAEAATHLGQGTRFGAGAVGFGCSEPAAVEVRAQLAADRPSGWELLAAIGKSEASGLAPRRGEGAARGSLHAATAGFGDTQ